MSAVLDQVKDRFITEWGALGSSWGINRTMAQIHAHLMSSSEPRSTDEIMEDLSISRGNAHSNIKELLSWGMIKKVVIKGKRKEHFLAEKDPLKIFCLVARERKRREVEPVLNVLKELQEELKGATGKEAQEFQKQIKGLAEFVEMGNNSLEKISKAEKSSLIKWLMKVL